MEAALLPVESGPDQDLSPIIADGDVMSPWAFKQYIDKYSWKDEQGDPNEVWPDTAYRVVRNVLGALGYTDAHPDFQALLRLVTQRKFIPGGRYLASSGRQIHQTNNCFLYRCEDSREGWADLVHKSIMALSSGGGIGVVYSDVRPNGSLIKKTGGIATGPLSPANMVNEVARHVMQGGHRRSAIWGGLHWNHPDIFDWIKVKDWSEEIKKAKEKDTNSPAPMDMTNISVILDSEFFFAYQEKNHPKHDLAMRVYWSTLRSMISTGEPGFSIDVGQNARENLRNACTEITSEDDSDVCNLGSLNMARITDKEEFREAVRLGMLFLIAGTVYSDVPHEEVRLTREKNRRTGLGLMGVHEWLLKRGHRYEMNDELAQWLEIYKNVSDKAAVDVSSAHNLTVPIKRRAIAPNGTIGIIGETTTSAEPIFCVAYKRRFIDNDRKWKFQYIIDPTAHRLITEGIDPDDIETAYALSYNVERRIAFQADLQEYVDHGISSTINLPYPIVEEDEVKDFGLTLMKYLPKLRGITCYPDGARSGQPLEVVPYEIARGREGVTLEEDRDQSCASGVCGV